MRALGAWMQVVDAPDAESETFSAQEWRCFAEPEPSRLPGRLLLIRRGFGCVALGFAQRSLLLLFSLFFLGACACCPLSLGPVSTVIRLECHWLPPCAAGCLVPRDYIYARVRVLPVLATRLRAGQFDLAGRGSIDAALDAWQR